MHLDKLWEEDEFLEENDGLIVAEIELDNEDEDFQLRDWVAHEATKTKGTLLILHLHPALLIPFLVLTR